MTVTRCLARPPSAGAVATQNPFPHFGHRELQSEDEPDKKANPILYQSTARRRPARAPYLTICRPLTFLVPFDSLSLRTRRERRGSPTGRRRGKGGETERQRREREREGEAFFSGSLLLSPLSLFNATPPFSQLFDCLFPLIPPFRRYPLANDEPLRQSCAQGKKIDKNRCRDIPCHLKEERSPITLKKKVPVCL